MSSVNLDIQYRGPSLAVEWITRLNIVLAFGTKKDVLRFGLTAHEKDIAAVKRHSLEELCVSSLKANKSC